MNRNIIATKKETPHIMTEKEVKEDLKQYEKWTNKVRKQMIIVGIIALLLVVFCFIIKK